MIIPKKYTIIKCVECDKELKVRNDYLKKHKGRCNSCQTKLRWSDPEYAKRCSDSHLGQKPCTTLPLGEAAFRNLFYYYKKSAQDRGFPFLLSKEEFKILTKQNCYYCGVEPLQEAKPANLKNGIYLYNGIDRKDDNIGYEINNCVTSCKKCNYMKQGLTDIEFFEHIQKILESQQNKGQ